MAQYLMTKECLDELSDIGSTAWPPGARRRFLGGARKASTAVDFHPGAHATREVDAEWRPESGGHLATSSSVPVLPAVHSGSSYIPPTLEEKLATMKKVKKDPSRHLRRHCINMGAPPNLTTTYQRDSSQPVKMANDPMWSTDLKRIDKKTGKRLTYERRVTGAVQGSLVPCPTTVYPKAYLDL
eukprot:TRINITY_DN121731_c0_g1_i1.p1 TRINITY_DN121731_c0_g1~~TRINITY_DN121731_c0_g1_i1.p1  ORF type:complete len:207 (+),score=26.34 TRINITY_DN121731_c0_g1_i1:70-621(+)